MKGPKPIPLELKRLAGNPGKRPLPAEAPKPAAQMPQCPPHLKGEARREWNRMVKLLRPLRYITKLDRGILAGYSDAWGAYVEATRGLERGLLLRAPDGKDKGAAWPVWNPWYSIQQKAWKQMLTSAAELGFTPSARTRIRVNGTPQEEDPKDRRYGL